jgi:putative transposase
VARQLRIEFEGAFYHITSRGNQRERIFFEDKDKEMFLEILKRTKERYGYLLHAYVLMDNHYHFLIETPKANISQTMQNVNTSYTVHINRKYKRSGHLFQGRFKGLIVDKDEYLVTLSRYIHLNPVRAGIVQRPTDYRWTSYRAYSAESNKDELVDVEDTLSIFSARKAEAVKGYTEFVEGGIVGGDNPFAALEGGIILGGKSFMKKIKGILGRMKADEEIPQMKQLRASVSIDGVLKTCCSYYGKGREDLLQRRNGERNMAVYLSKLFSGKKNIEIGKYFGIKGPAVSNVIKIMESRLETDKRLKSEIEILKGRVINEE